MPMSCRKVCAACVHPPLESCRRQSRGHGFWKGHNCAHLHLHRHRTVTDAPGSTHQTFSSKDFKKRETNLKYKNAVYFTKVPLTLHLVLFLPVPFFFLLFAFRYLRITIIMFRSQKSVPLDKRQCSVPAANFSPF